MNMIVVLLLLLVPTPTPTPTPAPGQEPVAFMPGMRFSQPLNYPVRALVRDLPGVVVLSCAVLEDGLLDGCAVVSESPVDVGFGPAAVRSANGGRLSALASEAYAGQRITFSVKFRIRPERLDEADEGTRP
ncbi:MAG: energy transducer TonB [Brevundimonas sp.]